MSFYTHEKLPNGCIRLETSATDHISDGIVFCETPEGCLTDDGYFWSELAMNGIDQSNVELALFQAAANKYFCHFDVKTKELKKKLTVSKALYSNPYDDNVLEMIQAATQISNYINYKQMGWPK